MKPRPSASDVMGMISAGVLLNVIVAAALDKRAERACAQMTAQQRESVSHIARSADKSVHQLDRDLRRLERHRELFEPYIVERANSLDRDYLPGHRHGIEIGTPESDSPPTIASAKRRNVGVPMSAQRDRSPR